MKYIHYGSNEFDINKFEKIKNKEEFVKPLGGLWASRVDINTGWKNWCLNTGFDAKLDEYFIFSLKEDTKILTIDNNEQLKELPKLNNSFELYCNLDFEKLSEEYDAIEVLISKDQNLYFSLYGWDCDSIVVMNPSKIIQEK